MLCWGDLDLNFLAGHDLSRLILSGNRAEGQASKHNS